jgi:hypothetical protein
MNMDKGKLRRKLLEGMCFCAQEIADLYYTPISITFTTDSECPKSFKPGVADKFLFGKIIDRVMDNITEELSVRWGTNPKVMGVNIMATYYYPKYGEWIFMPQTIERLREYPRTSNA